MHLLGLGLLIGLFVLLLAGVIMIKLLGALSVLIPAAFFAFLVWLVTRSLPLSGAAFLAFVLLSQLRDSLEPCSCLGPWGDHTS